MAYPTVAATNNSNSTTLNATTHTVNLPANISAGDLLLIFFSSAGGIEGASINTPSGWSSLGLKLGSVPDGEFPRQVVFYKTASGSEGSSVNVSTNQMGSSHVTYRITGWSGTPEISTGAIGTSSTPDCDTLTPSGGSKEYLWIALCSTYQSAGGHTISGYPTGYTGSQVFNNGNGNSGCPKTAVSTKNATASSDNPSTYATTGWDSGDGWTCRTLAISPLVSGPANLKTYNTNAKANIKTINTNAIANVKTLNTNV